MYRCENKSILQVRNCTVNCLSAVVTFFCKKHTLIDIVDAIESALTMTKIAGLDAKKYHRNHHLDHLVVGVISAYWLSVSLFCSDGVVEEFPRRCIVFVLARSSLEV